MQRNTGAASRGAHASRQAVTHAASLGHPRRQAPDQARAPDSSAARSAKLTASQGRPIAVGRSLAHKATSLLVLAYYITLEGRVCGASSSPDSSALHPGASARLRAVCRHLDRTALLNRSFPLFPVQAPVEKCEVSPSTDGPGRRCYSPAAALCAAAVRVRAALPRLHSTATPARRASDAA